MPGDVQKHSRRGMTAEPAGLPFSKLDTLGNWLDLVDGLLGWRHHPIDLDLL
jgi:hypothetical protein